ncbi:MAG: hypothetical protein E7632_04940 [Ruminococcaceae bacterium]|nr:hypothetical protein [Oscillospiraceae bacterium]
MLKCNSDGKFTILVTADPQCDNDSQWAEAARELEILIERAKPDFVLINGDMETNNRVTGEGWATLIAPLTECAIPWATTNGNHDPYDPSIDRIYTDYADCLNEKVSPDDPDYEPERPVNYRLPVYANDGRTVVFAIYGMDSGMDRIGWNWDGFTEKQLAWYKRQSDALKAENGGKPVTSLMCCHIPFEEVKTMDILHGVCHENVTCTGGSFNRGTMQTILAQGDVKIAVFGHSHNINRVGKKDGIILAYAGKISSGSYHDEFARGGRIITFHQDTPEAFATSWLGTMETSEDQPEVSL